MGRPLARKGDDAICTDRPRLTRATTDSLTVMARPSPCIITTALAVAG
ncbi:hypothetical protein [Paraburkholderia sp.]